MEDFEKKVREIFYYIGEYGIKHKPLDFRYSEKISEADKREFKKQVHKGFRLGQEKIIEEILPLFAREKKLKDELTGAKKLKNKEAIANLLAEEIELNYKINVLRHFAVDKTTALVMKGNNFQKSANSRVLSFPVSSLSFNSINQNLYSIDEKFQDLVDNIQQY